MIKCDSGNSINLMFGTGASSHKDYDGLYSVIKTALENGIRGFDTAPSYGTEEILGVCLERCMKELGIPRAELFVQTKVDARQMMEDEEQIKEYIKEVMQKMKVEYLDALLIHWPVPEYFDKTWACLAELQREGVVRYIGVCNVRMRQLQKFHELEVMPQIVQIERNPLRICVREIRFCSENGIAFQAYSPLCKMHDDIKTSQVLNRLASKYQKNVGQIVMRWQLDTGAIPIFTSKKTSRVKEYTELFDFSLTSDEINKINQLNRDYKMYLEACACPGF